MIDKLNELEERIRAILGQLRQCREKNAELSSAREEMTQRLSGQETLAEENRTLREKVRALETEIGSFGKKEGEIRGRLETILERITTLEQEIQESGKAPQ